MKCVHTFGTGRHKRQADITFLFQYIYLKTLPCVTSVLPQATHPMIGFLVFVLVYTVIYGGLQLILLPYKTLHK